MVADCACDFCISPRSALTRTPKATDAITIAIVERMRFIDGFILIGFPPRLRGSSACASPVPPGVCAAPLHDMTNIESGSSASRRSYAARHIFVENEKAPRRRGRGVESGFEVRSDDVAPADDQAIDEEQNDGADDR